MDLKKFRIVLNMSHFFDDHRAIAYVLISNKMHTILDLENKVSKMFGIDGFYLVCQDKYLPTEEDIALLEREDVVWVVPKSASKNTEDKNNISHGEPEKQEVRNIEYKEIEEESEEPKHKRKKLQHINCNNIPKIMFSEREKSFLSSLLTKSNHVVNTVASFKTETNSFEDKIRKHKRKKQKTEVNNVNEIDLNDHCHAMETDTKQNFINNNDSLENETICCIDKIRKTKKTKQTIELNDCNEMDLEDHHYDAKGRRKKLNVPSGDFAGNETSICNDVTKKTKRKKKIDDNSQISRQNVDDSNIGNKTDLGHHSYEIDNMKQPILPTRVLVAEDVTNNMVSDEYIVKRKKKIKGDNQQINENNKNMKDCSFDVEYTKITNEVTHENKIPSNGSSINFTNSEDLELQNKEGKHSSTNAIVNSNVVHGESLIDEKAQIGSTTCDSQHNFFRKENKHKAAIKSHFIIEPSGGILEQSLVSEGTAVSDMSVNSDAHTSSSTYGSRNSLGRLLAELRSESPHSVMSTDISTPSKRKRIRKRKRKTKETVTPEVPTVVFPKPLIIPAKPAIHIKFDNDSGEDCSGTGKKSCLQNKNIVPPSMNDSAKEILHHTPENCSEQKEIIFKAQEVEVCSELLQNRLVPAEVENKLSICKAIDVSETIDKLPQNKSQSIKVENNDLLTSETTEIPHIPNSVTEFSKQIMVVPPSVGDLICFKVFRMNANYNPEISSPIIGKVHCVGDKVTVKLIDGLDQCISPMGKFHLDLEPGETEAESDIKEFEWSQLIEPKLHVSCQSNKT